MNKIINILKEEKSIPIDKYIDIALYDKKFGYYSKKNPFGKNGDYITSPLISVLFSEMISIWCVGFWEHLGKPKKISIIELGPGDGTLCKNLLQNFINFKKFHKCLEIKLLEKSDRLIKIQKNNIKSKKVQWIKDLDVLKTGPIIFFGNEFFDALPIKQICIKKKLLFEKFVGLTKDKQKIKFLYKRAEKKLIKDIKKFNLINSGDTIEYPASGIKYLNKISKKIKKYNGALLTFDYGYIEEKNKNTLQAVKSHKYYNILKKPGTADITHHLNYKLFIKILKKNNLDVEEVVTQSEFLQRMGIIERANILAKKITFKSKADMFYRVKKLIDHSEMGSLFKVLLAQKKKNKFFLGFK